MADKTFNDLTATTTVAAADIFAMENAAGNSRGITGTNLANGLKTLGFRGAMAVLSADLTTINASAGYAVPWAGADVYDTDSIHDPSTNNTRLTTPSDCTYIRLYCGLKIAAATAADLMALYLRYNGGTSYNGGPYTQFVTGTTGPSLFVSSPPILVATPGTDYFEAYLTTSSDTSITITNNFASYFAMEIIA